MSEFFVMLNPMLVLFLCISIGYALSRAGIVPKGSAAVLSKVETWVFCSALNFITMARSCTVESLSRNGTVLLLGLIAIGAAILVSLPLGALLAGKRGARGVFTYGIALGNFGYLCDPVVLSLFGEEALAYYKFFTLPMSILVYTWGIALLVPGNKEKGGGLKRLINMPMLSMLLGIAVGLLGLADYLPLFFVNTLDSLKNCMGPFAMIIAGITVAGYGILPLLKNTRVYVTSVIKLIAYPAVFCGLVYLLTRLFERISGMQIGNIPVFLAFFAFGCPLGLNTVVFPESYGGDSRPGASMAVISNTLAVITMPLIYALVVLLVGEFSL